MPGPPGDRCDKGFIIVAVLWILATLATLSLIYSLYVREAALNFVIHDERVQTEALAESGVELAAYQLTAQPNKQPLQGSFSFRQGSATIAVKFRSENSLIDLNFAPKELLAGLFGGIGVQSDDALAFADRIIAWRTPLRAGVSDSEAALYAAAGKTYGPRHGAFEDPGELAMVVGIPPVLVDRVLPDVTVYSGQPEVNLLSAPAQVLAALPGLTPDRLQFLLGLRSNDPQDVVKAQLGNIQQYVTLDPSKANRVTVDVQFQSGGRTRTQAIVFLAPQDAHPYRVLLWRNNVSGASND
jgi:general secretion pathway protein K